MPRARRFTAALALTAVLAAPGAAGAYPLSVLYAPTGDVRRLGQVGNIAFTSLLVEPRGVPGQFWFASEVGVMPEIPYGASGVGFGGLEVGVDLHNADLFGTPANYVKTLFNAKAQLLTERDWTPNVAVAFFASPFQASRSINALFVVATKTLLAGATPLGRFTAGLSRYFNGDRTVFYGTPPFFQDTRWGLVAGYESPAFGPFSLAIDHVGGVGELSSTNLGLGVTPQAGVTVTVGAYAGNDRRTVDSRYLGVFAAIAVAWSVRAAPRP